MNFFDAQDRAKRSTRLLVISYIVATIIIVAGVTLIVALALASSSITTAGWLAPNHRGLLIGTALATTALIVGATLIKTASLSSGGARVAIAMGGVQVSPDTSDPLKRRLRNVVEEMSIASGVSTPDIFILEEEQGINAFAAGYTPNDAAIAVTRGTLELLSRDELQGVIAHEFSHVLNGDMRLNIRMMGVLYGIMVLGLLGRVVLRGSHYGALSSRRSKNAPALLLIGLGLAVLGGVGVLVARLVKAAVSRQREMLADASAVQFTRQTAGIANALKKIGGFSQGSHLTAADPEEVSHMLFGPGAKLASMFATHPPIVERIQALDPSFKPDDFPDVDAAIKHSRSDGADERISGLAAPMADFAPDSVIASVGQPTPGHIALATSIRASFPPALYNAAHSSRDAYLLTIALMIDPEQAERQLAVVRDRLGSQRTDLVEQFVSELTEAGQSARLPLLEIAFPALKQRPMPQLEYLVDLLARLIDVDGRTSLFEYCFYRIIVNNLDEALDPTARPKATKLTRKSVQQAALNLLRITAHRGSRKAADAAFAAGIRELPEWAQSAQLGDPVTNPAALLDSSIAQLNALNPEGKELMIRALSATIDADDRTTHVEAEILRAICAMLDCPLPPINSIAGHE